MITHYLLQWEVHATKWPTNISVPSVFGYSKGSDGKGLNNASIGKLYRSLDPDTKLNNRTVILRFDYFDIEGTTDSEGKCWFDLSNLNITGVKQATLVFAGDEYNEVCHSESFIVQAITVNPNGTGPGSGPSPDTNDTNSSVDPNTTNNDTNSILDTIKPLEDISKSLPVTGTDAMLFGLLVCIVSISTS